MPVRHRRPLARFNRASMICLTGAALLATSVAARSEESPAGLWRVEDGKALIRIVDCGGKYWGVVAWEKSPGIDRKNPNPALRSRPTLGMPVLLALTPDQSGEWRGRIYNAEDGQTYDSNVKLAGAGHLRVEGCVLGIMCGGETWSRAAGQAVAAAGHQPPAHGTTGTARAKRSIADETPTQVCSGIGRR